MLAGFDVKLCGEMAVADIRIRIAAFAITVATYILRGAMRVAPYHGRFTLDIYLRDD